MKHTKEIRVALIAIIALVLLYFGFNFLKGVNIFSSVNEYHGRFAEAHGLVEQSPVYVRGYKVGQVEHIAYDFSRDSAFLVTIRVNDDVRLPLGTQMALIQDGLLGGRAIDLQLAPATMTYVEDEAFLPTVVVPGLMEKVEQQLLAKVSGAVTSIDSLVCNVNGQLGDNRIRAILCHVDSITTDLTSLSADLKRQMPGILTKADTTLDGVQEFARHLRLVKIEQTVQRVDSALDKVNDILASVNSTDGTLGLLLNDSSIYRDLDATIVSVDSLLTDIKNNPRRYINISVFGPRDPKPKKEVKPLGETTKKVLTNSK